MKLCVSTCLFYTVQVDTAYQKTLYNSCLFLFLCHGIQETKEHVLHKWGFTVFCSKKNFCIITKIKLVWFYSLYIIFLSKNLIFLYIFKIFFNHVTLKIYLKYWIILHIFRISLCVTGPLQPAQSFRFKWMLLWDSHWAEYC